MSIPIFSPRNSFIQFNGATNPDSPCFDTEQLCLPINDVDDIFFQVTINKATGQPPPVDDDDYHLYICKGCEGFLYQSKWTIPGLAVVQAGGDLNFQISIIGIGSIDITVADSHDFTMALIVSELNNNLPMAGGFWSFIGQTIYLNTLSPSGAGQFRIKDVDSGFFVVFIDVTNTANVVGDGCGLLWRTTVDRTKFYGIPHAWDDDLSALLTPGECFNLCITGPTGFRVSWDMTNLPSVANSGATHFAFNIIGLPGTLNWTTTDSHALTMPELAGPGGLLNSFWGAYGTFSWVGNTLYFDTNTFVNAGTLSIQWPDGIATILLTFPAIQGYGPPSLIACSNCFIYTPDTCFSTKIAYRNDNNSMGFEYNNGDNATPFINVVRLPFFLKNGQPISTKNVFRLSDGNYRKTSEIMELEFYGEVEWINLDWHTKLAVALAHQWLWIYDNESFSATKYVMDVDAKYEIDWSANKRGTNFALAPASFVLKQMPFENFTNSCCNES